MERAIDAITITPTAVVDAGARPIVPTVLSAASTATSASSSTTNGCIPEPAGFWLPGRRTVADHRGGAARPHAPVVLRIHSGGKANLATFTTFDWERDYSLVPGQAAEVELPMVNGSVIPLTVTVADGFSPREIDPSSNDTRFLGIWVEVSAADRTADKKK